MVGGSNPPCPTKHPAHRTTTQITNCGRLILVGGLRRQAIGAASTAEEVMELYIRHIGMNSFLFFFKKKDYEELAQLLLFPEGDSAWQPRARSANPTSF